MNTLTYLKNLARDKNIASVTPTSAFGVKRICRAIDFQRAKVIVEYGPGGGVITKRLLKQMRSDAVLIAVETNKNFCRLLASRIKDPRLHIVNRSAEDVLEILAEQGFEQADYIISGIPFSLFPNSLKDRILRNTGKALGQDGRFFVYQFLVSLSKPETDIKRKLKEHMRIERKDVEMLNVPPLRIYEASNGKAFKAVENY
jgi:phospholipid N-methyltransferase